jgi:hypothetical protein
MASSKVYTLRFVSLSKYGVDRTQANFGRLFTNSRRYKLRNDK